MTIPHDNENRWWVETSGENPALVDSFRPALVAFMGFDRDKNPKLAGTGFFLASSPNIAIALSAKHVIAEGVLKAQNPHPGHASSAIFIPNREKIPSLHPEKMKAVWMGKGNAAMLDTSHACYNDSTDIASCIIIPQPKETIAEHISIPIDLDIPPVGEVIHMVSMEDMTVDELAPPQSNKKGQVLQIYRKISVRIGVVTAVYPEGHRQYQWPCFTTSIPAKPGTSGGFVYWPREGITIAACGVVCADNSTDEAHQDSMQSGESIIGCTWPALGLRTPLSIPAPPEAETYTLYEMIRRGHIPQPIGNIDRVKVQETGNGDCRIHIQNKRKQRN